MFPNRIVVPARFSWCFSTLLALFTVGGNAQAPVSPKDYKLSTKSRTPGIALLMLCVFCHACAATQLPTAPSELPTGIVVYEHANFQGASAHITSDISDLRNADGPCEHESSGEYSTTRIYNWNDCISSVRVAAG